MVDSKQTSKIFYGVSVDNDISKKPTKRKSYLTILWSDLKTVVVDRSDSELIQKQRVSGVLNDGADKAGIKYQLPFGFPDTVSTLISGLSLPNGTANNVAHGITSIMKDGKITDTEVYNSFVFGTRDIIDTVASKFGNYSSSMVYDLVAPLGNGLASKAFASALHSTAKDKIESKKDDSGDSITVNYRAEKVEGLLIDLTNSDEETYDSEVPERKVEKGFSYTDVIHNSVAKKSFECSLIGSGIRTAQQIKEQLLEIRNSQIPFGIVTSAGTSLLGQEIKEEAFHKCLFTSLSFKKSSQTGDVITCSMSIVPMVEGSVKYIYVNNIPVAVVAKRPQGSGFGNSLTVGSKVPSIAPEMIPTLMDLNNFAVSYLCRRGMMIGKAKATWDDMLNRYNHKATITATPKGANFGDFVDATRDVIATAETIAKVTVRATRKLVRDMTLNSSNFQKADKKLFNDIIHEYKYNYRPNWKTYYGSPTRIQNTSGIPDNM